ncbi:MAG: hypothetical protein K2J77_01630, partial [Oscillospiraceae bacterium]|nr:hypothetical protein [Oscillospiraceae bacterium]
IIYRRAYPRRATKYSICAFQNIPLYIVTYFWEFVNRFFAIFHKFFKFFSLEFFGRKKRMNSNPPASVAIMGRTAKNSLMG